MNNKTDVTELIGAIIHQSMEDLFEKPVREAPKRVTVTNTEDWIKNKNLEIECDRYDAFDWLQSENFKRYGIEADYLASEYFCTHRESCIPLYSLLQAIFKLGQGTMLKAMAKKDETINALEMRISELERKGNDYVIKINSMRNLLNIAKAKLRGDK